MALFSFSLSLFFYFAFSVTFISTDKASLVLFLASLLTGAREECTVPQPSQFFITAREHLLQNAGGSLALIVELWVL